MPAFNIYEIDPKETLQDTPRFWRKLWNIWKLNRKLWLEGPSPLIIMDGWRMDCYEGLNSCYMYWIPHSEKITFFLFELAKNCLETLLKISIEINCKSSNSIIFETEFCCLQRFPKHFYCTHKWRVRWYEVGSYAKKSGTFVGS